MSRQHADVVVRKQPTIIPEDPDHPIAGGLWSLTVNGQELAHQVAANGLHVSFPAGDAGYAHVTITLVADVVLNLPNSVVQVQP